MKYGIWVKDETGECWENNGMGVPRVYVNKADAEEYATIRRKRSMPGITFTVKELKE